MGEKPSSIHTGAPSEPWTYWYGSQLHVSTARKLAEYNSATSLQVTASVVAAMIWAIRHPNEGILEPDELPHDEILEIADPYLEPLVGVYSTWTPLEKRDVLFREDIDVTSPFQFKNFRVAS